MGDGRWVNNFTSQNQLSVLWAFWRQSSAAVGRILAPTDGSPQIECFAGLWRAGCAKFSVARSLRPRGHWESPVGPPRRRAGLGGASKACPPRSRSAPWQTQEIPCLYHHGCEQRSVWPAEVGAIFAVRHVVCRCASFSHLTIQPPTAAPWGPMPGESGVRHPCVTTNPRIQPPKHPSMPSFSGVLFVFCSRSMENAAGSPIKRKCKVLLHLGNSVAFFVDNPRLSGIRFVDTHSFRANRVPVPPHTSFGSPKWPPRRRTRVFLTLLGGN